MHKVHDYRPRGSSQQWLVGLVINKFGKRSEHEVVVVHHVLDDSYYRGVKLQIERRCPVNGIKFERVVV